MKKAVILVDEINAMHQFHNMGVEGINPWVSFYETTEKWIKELHQVEDVGFHIYGASVPRELDEQRHSMRRRFFKSLIRDGINVHKAFCLPNVKTNLLEEKGVDMLLGLDILLKAQEGIKHLFVFSGDTDLIPAIQRAQKLGSKVTAIIGKNQPATMMRRYANKSIFLEDIVRKIPSENIVIRKGAIA